jgi:hypothetical protein
MTRELTAAERETIEQELVECFALTQHEIAAELGIEPQPDGDWSDGDAERIMAEIDRRRRPLITAQFLLD